jgi:D-amino-acid dehydrogenase
MDVPVKDIVVAGGGVIGLSCALELLERGREVTVLDTGRVGSGSSHGNCGTITPSHAPPLAAPGMVGQALRWMLRADAPLYIRPRWDPDLWRWLGALARRCNAQDWRASGCAKGALLQVSRRALGEWVERFQLDCEFRASGLIYAFRSARSLDTHAAHNALLDELGIASEVWSTARLLREEPALRGDMAGGLYFPGDACLRPDRLVAELASRVRERGGEIREFSGVETLEAEPRRCRLQLADGSGMLAARLVLATGAWSPRWSQALGLRIPIQPGKGYSITYQRPEQAPQRPLVLKERSVCVTAWDSGFRLGSTMEFSGYDPQLSAVRLSALERSAGEYLRDPVGPARSEEWYGWRPMSLDDLPMIGPLPGRESVLLATGHGMMGVSMSTATAQLIGAQLTGDEPPLDPRPYRPERFA